MRICRLAMIASILYVTGATVLFGAPGFVPPKKLTIGRNLEVFTTVRLAQPAPEGGLEVTVTSNNPAALLFARNPGETGSKSIKLKINSMYVETPDFYVQAVGPAGLASYTISAPGLTGARGTVTIGRSAILIAGPSNATAFRTTPAMSTKISVYSVLLNPARKLLERQAVAGGRDVKVEIVSSQPSVGGVVESHLTIGGGDSVAATEFKPGTVGSTTLRAKAPVGFTVPLEHASVAATVDLPGIGVTGDINLGKDLQIEGAILLGEPPPPSGLDVVLKSSDPSKLLFSARHDEPGVESLTVHIPAGQARGQYFLQGLSDSGTVNYTASAPGFRTRTAPVTLVPSGIMVVYSPYGAPDRAEVERAKPTRDLRPFTVSLSEKRPSRLTVFSVYLDPATKRGADVTVQGLRAGVKVKVELTNSNPQVGKVAESVVVSGGGFTETEITPIAPGQTTIAVKTPPGFETPTNATSVTATVKE